MAKSELTKRVLKFKETGDNQNTLEQEIAFRIYSSPILKKHLTAEQLSSFLCWFYPEILKTAKRFRYRGKPFEAYINYILVRRVNSFLKADILRNEIQNIFEDSRFGNREIIQHCDDFCRYEQTENSEKFRWLADAGKKRILYLFLREYAVSDPQKLSIVSRLTGYDEKWVQKCGEVLRDMVHARSRRYRLVTKRRNYTYYLIFRTEKRLLKAVTEEEKKNLREIIKNLKNRLEKTNAALEKISLIPSHKEIAEATGTPKGSVDSGLFYLKRSICTGRSAEKDCA